MRTFLRIVLALLTMLILSNGILSAQTVHQVAAGTDVLKPAIDGAAAGDIIELTSSGGLYLSADQIKLDKDLTIRAAEGLAEKPILKYIGTSTGAYMFKLEGSPKFMVEGLEFDGDGTAEGGAALAKYALRLDNGDTLGTMIVKVMDCEMHDFNEKIIKPYADCGIDSLIVHNSLFYNGAKEGVCLYSGSSSNPMVRMKYAEIINCTFYNIEREAIKLDSNPDTKLLVDHVTCYNISGASDGQQKPFIYVDDATDVLIKNSVFQKNWESGNCMRLESDANVVNNCVFWDVNDRDIDNSDSVTDTLWADPLFADAANGDFTLGDGSPALGYADDGLSAGDARWDPTIDMPTVHQVEAGTDMIDNAVDAAEDGDIIELVTSGGLYFETSSIYIENKSLTIRASEDLAQKPMIQNDNPGEASGVFRISTDGNLTLQGVEFFDAKHLIRVDNGGTSSVLKIDDCYGHNGAETLIKVYGGSWLDSLIVTNTIFRDAVKEGIYLKEVNTFGYAKFENCTFIHTGREAIRARDNNTATLIVNHCTFDSICYNSDYRAIYPEGVENVEIKNTIISNKLGTHEEAVKIYGTSSIHHVNIFNSGEIQLVDNATMSDTLWLDPLYFNPAEDDYRLADNSPCRGVGDDGRALGDLRWEVSTNQYFLTMITEGKGTATLDPEGPWYDPGTTVTITAVPDAEWKVTGWEGVVVFPPDAESATVTMDADKEVKVIFEPKLEKFSVNITNIGVGHVELDPAPVDDENMLYYDGTEVTFTAVSDTSSMEFSAWSGDLTGTDNPTTLTVTSDVNVTATYVPVVTQFVLDVDTVGLGNVTYIPMPYSDYGTYDSASVVTLIAEPLAGFEFTGWSGDMSGSGDSLTVVMDSDVSITATFEEVTVAGGVLAIDTTWNLQDAVEFARNNSQVHTIEITTDGGHFVNESFINVNFPLTVRAKEGLTERPKIEGPGLSYSSGVFQIKVGGSHLTLQGLEIFNGKYAVRTDDDELTTEIRIDDCYIHDAGEVWVKVYIKSMVDSLIITNSLFRECKKEGVYLKEPNTIKYARLENSTFIRCGREAFRVRDNNDMVVMINHCNFDSTDWESDYRVIYPEGVQNATVKNSIITNQLFTVERHSDYVRLYGTSHSSNMVIFNASTRVDLEEDATTDTTTTWEFDPLFEAPEMMNYTLTAASHAYGLADDGTAAGDPRWATETPEHKMLTISVDGEGSVHMDPMPVGKTYDPGQTVTVTAVADSGYEFLSWGGALSGSNNPETVNMDNDVSISATFKLVDAIGDLSGIPDEYAMHQNYPNPFNPQTTIRYDLKKAGQTTIKVYDVLGREVATLVDQKMQAGKYKVVFFKPQLATGVYFYQIKSGDFVSMKKMLLVK